MLTSYSTINTQYFIFTKKRHQMQKILLSLIPYECIASGCKMALCVVTRYSLLLPFGLCSVWNYDSKTKNTLQLLEISDNIRLYLVQKDLSKNCILLKSILRKMRRRIFLFEFCFEIDSYLLLGHWRSQA